MGSQVGGDYIFICYSESEFYGRQVKHYLDNGPVEVIAIDYEKPQPFCLEILGGGSWELVVDGRRLAPPAAAWARNKSRLPPRIASERDVARKLALTEWAAFGAGLSHLLGERLLNPIGHATHKIFQHHLALRAGFKVPPSTYFMGKCHALSAINEWNSAVLKPLGNPTLGRFDHETIDSQALVTTRVDEAMIREAAEDEFMSSPIWLQQVIGTGHELRVVVFGDVIYQSRIEGAIEDRVHIDSRQGKRTFVPVPEVDPELERSIRRYMASASLDYGVFDILVSQGSFWFLECNPDGQWESAEPFGMDRVIESAGEMILNKARGSSG